MLILGIETATWLGSVALVTESEVIAEYTLNIRRTHSERLMGMIVRMLSDAAVASRDLDGIAVSMGPGSFTGLRIGLSTVKGLCFANDLRMAAVPTLQAMASRMCFSPYPVCPVLDAKKREVYGALYDLSEGAERCVLAPCVLSLEKLLKRVSGTTIFSGEGATIFRDPIRETLGDQALFAPSHLAHPDAAAVARLGLSALQRGEYAEPFGIEPIYLRRSEAEIKVKERGTTKGTGKK